MKVRIRNKKVSPEEEKIDQIVIAEADRDEAWDEIEYLKEGANRGSREKFLEVMNRVPDVEPGEVDRFD